MDPRLSVWGQGASAAADVRKSFWRQPFASLRLAHTSSYHSQNTMTMKLAASAALFATALVFFGGPSSAFTTTSLTSSAIHRRPAFTASSVILSAATGESTINDDDANFMTPSASSMSMFSRRSLLSSAVAITASTSLLSYPIYPASAAADDAVSGTVVVAGATGQTGKRILDRLLSTSASSAKIIAGVRNVDKAMNALSSSSSTVKDALANKAVEFRSMDGEFTIILIQYLVH